MKRQDNIRERLFAQAEGRCIYCGHPITIETMEVDHIVPRSKGGGSNFGNKVCSCPRCNALKADKTIPEFLSGMPQKKRRAYENRLETLFMNGKLDAEKWDLLNPIDPPLEEPTDKVAEHAGWQIICYICGEFF